ncbi:MAG: hypothetical protein OXI50_11230 [Gammaproteobacteria bacterium]|nr:hypothetical protein [Gammaproteobacteria bacterium]
MKPSGFHENGAAFGYTEPLAEGHEASVHVRQQAQLCSFRT